MALIVPAEGLEDRRRRAPRERQSPPTIEGIRHVAATEPFTIENGLLPPTMKVKRRVAIETRRAAIEALSG